jgi:hypothetical protein
VDYSDLSKLPDEVAAAIRWAFDHTIELCRLVRELDPESQEADGARYCAAKIACDLSARDVVRLIEATFREDQE